MKSRAERILDLIDKPRNSMDFKLFCEILTPISQGQRLPKNQSRLLRHRAKMQRRYEWQFSKEGYEQRRKRYSDMAFFYTPAEPGTLLYRLNQPKLKDALYLWFYDQYMHRAMAEHPTKPFSPHKSLTIVPMPSSKVDGKWHL